MKRFFRHLHESIYLGFEKWYQDPDSPSNGAFERSGRILAETLKKLILTKLEDFFETDRSRTPRVPPSLCGRKLFPDILGSRSGQFQYRFGHATGDSNCRRSRFQAVLLLCYFFIFKNLRSKSRGHTVTLELLSQDLNQFQIWPYKMLTRSCCKLHKSSHKNRGRLRLVVTRYRVQ